MADNPALTPEDIEDQALMRPALTQEAQKLHALGYTVIASRFKAPSLFAWKAPDREQCLGLSLRAIRTGEANSLNVRLDGDLAALDMDFRDETLTAAFIAELTKRFRLQTLYTVRGSKGGKIFVRLSDKAQNAKTRYVAPPVYPPMTDFSDREAADAMRCELELKTDVSAVYGYHSPGLTYGVIPGTKPLSEARPQDLPELSLDDVRSAFKAAVKAASFVPEGGLKLTDARVQRAAAAIAYARLISKTCPALMPKLLAFLTGAGDLFAAQAVKRERKLSQAPTPYEHQLYAAIAQSYHVKARQAEIFRQLYAQEHLALADKLARGGLASFDELSKFDGASLQLIADAK